MPLESQTPLKIVIINAIATDQYNARRLELLRPELFPGTQLDMVSIEHGFPSLEYLSEELVNSYHTMEKAVWAEKAGYDAALINCFCDPGVLQARELVKIPIVGAGEATLFCCARLGYRFSVLSTSEKMIPKIERSIQEYNLDKSCAGVLSLGIGVPRLQEEGLSPEISSILQGKIQQAIDQGAEVITVGCTASIGIGKLLSEISPIPVVDPAIVSLKATEMAGSLYRSYGLTHSKLRAYAPKENWQQPA